MSPVKHTIISAALGVGLIVWLKSYPAGLACLLSGIFIDIDHHLDYCIAKKKFPWTYKELHAFCAPAETGRTYLVFHSYELLVLLWFSIYALHLGPMWLGLAVGLTSHLLCDQFTNPLKPLAYFGVYRLKNKFERRNLFTQRYFTEPFEI